MTWGYVIAAVGAMASDARDRAINEQRRQFDHYQRAMAPYCDAKRTPAKRHAKCESCGSREFREHHGQTVCAYCRSGA